MTLLSTNSLHKIRRFRLPCKFVLTLNFRLTAPKRTVILRILIALRLVSSPFVLSDSLRLLRTCYAVVNLRERDNSPVFCSDRATRFWAPKKDLRSKDFLGKGATCVKSVVFALARKPAKCAVLRRGGVK